ncbi:hypothetical protein [Rhizobium leguminosarum]
MTEPTASPKKTKLTVISILMEALDGRRLPISDHRDHAELAVGYANLHRRLARAMLRAFAAMETYDERRETAGGGGSLNETLDLALDAIYRLEEINEFYEKDIAAYFPAVQQLPQFGDYLKALSTFNRQWGVLCNKPKHNHAYLVAVEGVYECGSWTAGYMMCTRDGDRIVVDKRLHKRLEMFSFGATLRQILDTVIAMDVLAANLVGMLTDEPDAEPLQTYIIPLPYEQVMQKLFDPEHRFAGMPGEFCPAAVVDGEPVAAIEPGTGKLSAQIYYDFYGDNLKVRLPYGKGEFASAMMLREGMVRKPLTEYLRLVVRDIAFDPMDRVPYPFNQLQAISE